MMSKEEKIVASMIGGGVTILFGLLVALGVDSYLIERENAKKGIFPPRNIDEYEKGYREGYRDGRSGFTYR